MRKRIGFTLIELVIVIAIIGILASLAVPKFVDMSDQAKISATAGGLGMVRSVLATRYAASATGGAVASYPADLDSTDFSNSECPPNKVTSVGASNCVKEVYETQPPTANCNGPMSKFWFVSDPSSPDYGKAGACSDGIQDLSNL